MMRTWLNLGIAELCFVQLISGDREKETKINLKHLYPEPALVPLGEKPKV